MVDKYPRGVTVVPRAIPPYPHPHGHPVVRTSHRIPIAITEDFSIPAEIRLRKILTPEKPNLEKLLSDACAKGDVEMVKLLISKDVRVSSHTNISPMRSAVISGCSEIVKLLLENGADVDTKKITDHLKLAAGRGCDDIVRLLLNFGAKIDGTDDCVKSPMLNPTPLLGAISGKHESTVKILIQEGANVRLPSSGASVPILAAIRAESENMVKALLDNGAELDAPTTSMKIHIAGIIVNGETKSELREDCVKVASYQSPIELACSRCDNHKVVDLLIDRGANVNVSSSSGRTALHAAAHTGDPRYIRSLHRAGAHLDAMNKGNETPLQVALRRHHEEAAIWLIQLGADVNPTSSKPSPLSYACEDGSKEIVDELLRRGASVNVGDQQKATPLQAAAAGGSLKLVQALLEKGADPNAKSKTYENALQAACASSRKRRGLVELLLPLTADVNAEGRKHMTALSAAVDNRFLDAIKLLLNAGAIVDSDFDTSSDTGSDTDSSESISSDIDFPSDSDI